MSDNDNITFEIDPIAYMGSTLGNAYHSGLTLEDVHRALVTLYEGSTISGVSVEQGFAMFDSAISATIHLKELTKESQ